MRYNNNSRAYSYSSIDERSPSADDDSAACSLARCWCCGASSSRRRQQQQHQRAAAAGSECASSSEHRPGCCCGCISRMPFASLIATLMCCSGVTVFLVTTHRAFNATMKMFEQVFNYRMFGVTHVRIQDLHVAFIAAGAVMGVLALLILLIGCLSTGSTRTFVYKNWKARAGGRCSSIFLMVVTYILKLTWLFICLSMALASFVFFIWTGMCNRLRFMNVDNSEKCIDLRQFDFLLPEVSRDHQNICDEGKKKEFCHDYVESASMMYYIATAASIIVLISLIHYLMCLSANYTRIKDQAKIADLQILKGLEENEMGPLGAKGNANRY